ncbi:MAG: glycosyltransferase family 1 protein [Ignavibacterium sp.]|jgi:glycosyltransferase involved in cell wall biosynthesis|nr:glycosyltransferase family 1 protein [Ignavibacterium sp.]
MKIAVNLLPFREKIAGAGKYAKKIVEYLAQLDKINEYYLFISEKGKINFDNLPKNFQFVLAGFNPENVFCRIFWEQFVFPYRLKKLMPDIVFTPSVAVPIFYKGNFFTTIHDLAYKFNEFKYSRTRRTYIKFITNLAVIKSKVIFTVSNFSKGQIEKEFNLENKKVIVTYNGVSEAFFYDVNRSIIDEFRKKYQLPEKFLLYVGAIEPGKNLSKLFRMLKNLQDRNNDLKTLVLTSGIGWDTNSLNELIVELDLEKNIIKLPYLKEEEMPILYKSASVLLYLSEYEGFGIPVLEAMAAGTPIVTSKSEAILEFSKEAVYSVNPEDVNSIVKTLDLIQKDPEMKQCKIKKGKEIASNYSWLNSSKLIYEEFLKSYS